MFVPLLQSHLPLGDTKAGLRAEPVSAVRGREEGDGRRESSRPGHESPAAVFVFGSKARSLAEGGDQGGQGSPSDQRQAPFGSGASAEAEAETLWGNGEARPMAGPGVADDLSTDQQRDLEKLRKRDREVRRHEQAHKSAGGPYAGSISLQFETGPDGKRYAVGGSVPIDVSPVKGDPSATLRKMDVVRRAALAPANPSGADRRVAAQAARAAQQARAEMAAERYSQTQELAAEQRRPSAGNNEEPADVGAGLPGPMGRARRRRGVPRAPGGGAGGIQRLQDPRARFWRRPALDATNVFEGNRPTRNTRAVA